MGLHIELLPPPVFMEAAQHSHYFRRKEFTCFMCIFKSSHLRNLRHFLVIYIILASFDVDYKGLTVLMMLKYRPSPQNKLHLKKTISADNRKMKRNLYAGPLRDKIIVLAALVLGGTAGLFAAPLDDSYATAPVASASAEEKAAASRDARLKVLSAAEKYEHIPYRYGGLDRNGLDCSGLIYLSFRDALGVSLPRSTTGLYTWVEKIANEHIQPGDLLFFKTNNTGNISHAAIYTGDGRFIHAASDGPVTGVIYSSLGEQYWAGRYVGAGRALPKADMHEPQSLLPLNAAPGAVANGASPGRAASGGSTGTVPSSAGAAANTAPVHTARADSNRNNPPAASETVEPVAMANAGGAVVRPNTGPLWAKPPEKETNYLLLGFGLAPSWSGFYDSGTVLRGFASQVRAGYATTVFNKHMLFGVELRPEWDEGLGVFRIPVTLSWGFNDKFRVFFGPALSIGDAALTSNGKKRRYGGGTSLIGAVGVSVAPFIFKISGGELAPYAELAWQSYTRESSSVNLSADLAAGMRFSTGIRYTWKFK
jgi:probable lipoprotein NlpC